MKLLFETIIKFVLGIIIIGSLLFLPAGTFTFWNAWLFMGLLFIPMFFVGLVLWLKNKELLKKRINGREKKGTQRSVVFITLIMFVTSFVISGLDFKYNWSRLPIWLISLGSVTLLISYAIYIEVMRENTYLSRTVEIQENQKVIDTGLYGIVRHPMYAATILLFLTMPLILGSIISFIIFLVYPIIINKRIKNEEQVLEKDLEGYSEYKKKVKYKVIPFIW